MITMDKTLLFFKGKYVSKTPVSEEASDSKTGVQLELLTRIQY